MAAKTKKTKEPSWLFHCHYGTKALPLTVYDNHDGTFTYVDDDLAIRNADSEAVLRLFTQKMNSLVLDHSNLEG